MFVKKVFVSWQQTKSYFPKEKTEVIGNLTRPQVFKQQTQDKKLETFLKKPGMLLFVAGGNQGSHFLNQLIFKNITRLKNIKVLHQIGTANFKNDHETAKKINMVNYMPVDYVEASDIGAVFAASDLVLSRSGANTVWDLAILAKCAILTPLPRSASGEQLENAQILEKSGSAIVIEQNDWPNHKIEAELAKFTKNLAAHQKAATKFASTLPQDAAKQMAAYIADQI